MPTLFSDTPVQVHQIADVTVTRFNADINDLAWQTLRHLLPLGSSPGSDDKILDAFAFSMPRLSFFKVGTAYVNPSYLVQAPKPTRQFIAQSRIAQRGWFSQFNDIVHSSGRVKREMKTLHPVLRQLNHVGVMIIDNKHVWPNQWPQGEELGPKHNLVGCRFGKLIVIAMLPHGQCECQCDCGTRKPILWKHLRSRQTTSCGCKKDEREARLKARRRDRGWKHTGDLHWKED